MKRNYEQGKKSKGIKKFPKTRRESFKKDDYEDKSYSSKANDLSGSNDMKWYSLNKTLVEMSCRVPFGRPLGNKLELGYTEVSGGGTVTTGTTSRPIPGVMSFYMAPSIGCSLQGTQTIDVASKSIYSWVRHANSGHTNYDSPDLMLYLLACGNVYAAAGYMLKVYSCINKYEPTNRYYPDVILNALNVDPDFARNNIANLRYYMAQWWKKAASLFTPKKLPYFEKAFWMYTQIFEEDKTGKSGLYQYVPAGFQVFNATKYTTGGCLEYKTLPFFTSMTQFTTYFSAMLDVLINDEDMGIMSGDIKKAFDNDVWSLGDFPYDAVLTSVRDSFVLQQMHNTRPFHLGTNQTNLDIVQDNTTNELLYFPSFQPATNYDSIQYDVRGGGHIIDIDSEVPSTEEVMEASQYINSVTLKTSALVSSRLSTYATITGRTFVDNKDFILTNASDFICVSMAIMGITANGTISSQYYNTDGEAITSGTQTPAKVWTFCSWLSSFAFAPIFNLNTNTPFLGSVHNYSIIQSDVVDNIHDTAWLSLLCIPANEHLK